MRQFRIGILGCGYISNTYISDIQHFYKDLCMQPVLTLSRKWPGRRRKNMGSLSSVPPDELLSDDSLDIIVNLTPPELHPEVNRRIIEAGRHLFCEKPFAPTLKDAREILEAAVLTAIPEIIAYLCMQKSFEKGISAGALK